MITKSMPNEWKKTLCLVLCGLGLIWYTDVFAQDRRFARPEDPNAGEKRVALVIGNGAYDSSPLRNPPNDARAMAQALRGLSFEVIEKVDLDDKKMRKVIDEFGEKIRNGGVGLFYYSGHGVQANGRNYMIPVHAAINGEGDVEYESVEIGRVLGKMADARNRMNIVILDACRNNPYERSFRNATQGLAAITSAPTGTLIAYSTSPGSVAADGSGSNGTYTAELITQMGREGLKLEEVFKATRAGVQGVTGGKQVPWEHSSVVGDFYFMPPAGGGGTLVAGGPGPVSKPKPATGPKPGDIWKDPVTGMEFVWVQGGCYKMGQTETEKKKLLADAGKEKFEKFYADASPSHEVCLDGFWMGKTEVNRGQFKKFVEATGYQTEAEKDGWSWFWNSSGEGKWEKKDGMNWRNPGFSQDDRHPVVCVSWNDAHKMMTWISQKGNVTFLLPSEAQWEYACRAGTQTMRFWGNDPDKACSYANVADQAGKKTFNWATIHECDDGYDYTSPVASLQPNPYGLYDMLGNAQEWCEDVYIADIYNKSDKKNPIYSGGGPCRVIRGGSWFCVPDFVRCAFRNGNGPSHRNNNVGFRLLRMP
jgi:formylglycine-generating enzyme required for sulfatase activity